MACENDLGKEEEEPQPKQLLQEVSQSTQRKEEWEVF